MMIKPNFLYIGIARAGSTWLFDMLRQHPEIYVPPAKDIYYFDQYYEKGLDWYLAYFQAAGDAKAVGELSHDYYFCPEAPTRIQEALPEVRLICCLREPVSRLLSGYAYNRTTDVRRDVSIADYVEREDIAVQFNYHEHLKRFMDTFGRDRLLVVFYEDLLADPAAFIRPIYSFLGVDENFIPATLHERINPARDARAESVALLAYRLALILRRLGLANLVGRIKQSRLVNRVLYKAPERTKTEALPPELIARLRKDHDKLAALIGRPLPESWHG
jgi:hypothetical protein